jgi:surface polysaccharide O-acyltransferase-like enzyme
MEGKNQAGGLWEQELDYLRGFAILAVISIHTVANFTSFGTHGKLAVVNMFINMYVHFAVPLFIFISGFVLTFKYFEKYKIDQFYKKRALSILPQYIFLSIIYMLFFNGWGLPPTSEVMDKIWTGKAAYHMWYFILIIQLYVLYPVLVKVYAHFEKMNKTGVLLTAAWLLQIGFNVFNMFSGTALTNFFITHIFYFTLGMYVCRNYKIIYRYCESLSTKVLFPLSLLLTAAETSVWFFDITRYNRITGVLMVVGGVITDTILFTLIFILLYKLSSHVVRKRNIVSLLLKDFGENSYGIFMFHVIILEITAGLLWGSNIYCDNWIFYPILFGSTAIFSGLLVTLLRRMPYTGYLVTGKLK